MHSCGILSMLNGMLNQQVPHVNITDQGPSFQENELSHACIAQQHANYVNCMSQTINSSVTKLSTVGDNQL